MNVAEQLRYCEDCGSAVLPGSTRCSCGWCVVSPRGPVDPALVRGRMDDVLAEHLAAHGRRPDETPREYWQRHRRDMLAKAGVLRRAMKPARKETPAGPVPTAELIDLIAAMRADWRHIAGELEQANAKDPAGQAFLAVVTNHLVRRFARGASADAVLRSLERRGVGSGSAATTFPPPPKSARARGATDPAAPPDVDELLERIDERAGRDMVDGMSYRDATRAATAAVLEDLLPWKT